MIAYLSFFLFLPQQEIDYATSIWSGRDKPPLFLKMRRRVTLDAEERAPEFLAEILQMNWRVDLDAGLGVEDHTVENILVVCSAEMASAVLRACTGEVLPAGASVAVMAVEGTEAGDPAEWERLQKKLKYVVSGLPSEGETIKI